MLIDKIMQKMRQILRMQWKILIAFCAIWTPFVAFGESLSLEEAYNKALINNDGIKASTSNIDKAHKLSSAAKMLYAPNIDLIANYTYISEAAKINLSDIKLPNPPLPPLDLKISTNNIAYGILNITYPLFTGGRRIYANNLANLNIDDANYILNLKKLNLFEELVRTYYGLILNLEVLETLQFVEDGHKLHLSHAEHLEKQGQIAKIERLSAQVEYDKAKNKTNAARDSAEVALLAFKNLLQDSSISELAQISGNTLLNMELTDELKISEKELDSLESIKQKVLASYPMLKSIEVKKQQSAELSKIEMASFMPTIGLYGGYVMKDNSIALNKMIPSWYVGVGAKMSILSSSGNIFKYQASKIAQKEVDYALSQARKDILLLSDKTYKEATAAIESYKNLSSTLELAQENLKLQEAAFMNGMTDSSKVSDARNALSGAMIELKNAEYRYIVALAKLCVLTNDTQSFYTFYK